MSESTLRDIPTRVLNNIRKLISELSRRFRIVEVYLFGSYAKGTWIKTSDVDLIIVSPDFEGVPYLKRLDIIYKIEWDLGITPFIEVIPLTPDEFKRRIEESSVLRDARKYWIKIL